MLDENNCRWQMAHKSIWSVLARSLWTMGMMLKDLEPLSWKTFCENCVGTPAYIFCEKETFVVYKLFSKYSPKVCVCVCGEGLIDGWMIYSWGLRWWNAFVKASNRYFMKYIWLCLFFCLFKFCLAWYGIPFWMSHVCKDQIPCKINSFWYFFHLLSLC